MKSYNQNKQFEKWQLFCSFIKVLKVINQLQAKMNKIRKIYQICLYNPPQKSGPKGWRHKAGGFRTDFWGGFERKLQKKVHNGSENSENKKKYGVV